MIIRRKFVGGKALSDRVPPLTDKRKIRLSDFVIAVEKFCESDLSGIAELKLFGNIPRGYVMNISTERTAYLLKLMIKLSGEDGQTFIVASMTDDALLLGFRLSNGLPELSEIEEIRDVGLSAGFDITVSEGTIFALTEIKTGDAALGATSAADFLSTIASVFYD